MTKLEKAIARLSQPTEEARHYAFTPVSTADLLVVLDAAKRSVTMRRAATDFWDEMSEHYGDWPQKAQLAHDVFGEALAVPKRRRRK